MPETVTTTIPVGINRIDTTNHRWKVGEADIYIPAIEMEVEHTNLAGSSTGRTEDGAMHIDWIRRDIRKFHLKWSAMTQAELDYVMDLMQGKEYTLTAYDRGTVITANCYTGESKYKYWHDDESGNALYKDVEINAIEM